MVSSHDHPRVVRRRGPELTSNVEDLFKKCRRKDGLIDVSVLVEIGYSIVPSYGMLFGEDGYITKILEDDLIRHCDIVDKSIHESHEGVQDYICEELRRRSADQHRTDNTSGIHQLLWLYRVLKFIVTFLKYTFFTLADQPSSAAARRTYDEILRPYHGMIVGNLAALGLRLCPSRESLFKSLGYQTIGAAQTDAMTLSVEAEPILEEVHRLLAERGCDFPDVVNL